MQRWKGIGGWERESFETHGNSICLNDWLSLSVRLNKRGQEEVVLLLDKVNAKKGWLWWWRLKWGKDYVERFIKTGSVDFVYDFRRPWVLTKALLTVAFVGMRMSGKKKNFGIKSYPILSVLIAVLILVRCYKSQCSKLNNPR